jgi:hypothetical protein
LVAIFEVEGDEADIEEIEADEQQLVDGVGHFDVAVEGVYDEDSAVAEECAPYPNG